MHLFFGDGAGVRGAGEKYGTMQMSATNRSTGVCAFRHGKSTVANVVRLSQVCHAERRH